MRKSTEHSFYLKLCFDSDKTKIIELHFKELNELDSWCETLSDLNPVQRFADNHEFVLGNFGRDIDRCMACEAYFSGIFFQGYKCVYCESRVHKHCLAPNSKIQPCEDNVFGFKKNKPSICCLSTSESASSSGSTKSEPNLLEQDFKVIKNFNNLIVYFKDWHIID